MYATRSITHDVMMLSLVVLRYAAPREEHKRQFAYAPFGGGIHACLGQQFAYVQLRTVLSLLFNTFELELVRPLALP